VGQVFSGLEPGDSITLLDLGPGNSDTLKFLTQFRTRVYFADLMAHPALHAPPEDATPDELKQILEEQLDLPDTVALDVCLLWNYLNCLSTDLLEALSDVLAPRLSPTARAYGFGTLYGQTAVSSRYGIVNLDQLSARPMHLALPFIPHSQQRLNEHFPVFNSTRGTLLQQGQLELLFEKS